MSDRETARDFGQDLTSFERVISVLDRGERVLVTSHVQGDGDSVGSSVALALGLRRLGKEAGVLLTDLPEKYGFLVPAGLAEVPATPPGPEYYEGWDVGVLLDASEPSRIGDHEAGFFGASFPRICIDHHLVDPRPEFVEHHIEPGAPSSGSIVLRLLDALGVGLDDAIALALFVAIATDTGWFRFSNTTPDVFRDAGRLATRGIRLDEIYRRVYECFSLARVKLQGEVIARMRSELDGALVWSYLDRGLIVSSGVPRSSFEGLIDPLRAVMGSDVSALLTETEPDRWKLSLRSSERVNVRTVASRFGGGGHARAAGASLAGDLDAVSRRLREEVRRALT